VNKNYAGFTLKYLEDETIKLAIDLINRPSITPEDFGCQDLIAKRLANVGFNNESMVFEDTTNLWSRRNSKTYPGLNSSDKNEPVFCFAGHTDVVPVGDLKSWNTPPFESTIIDGMLYGRGCADMKGSLAAMVVATERFVENHPEHHGCISYLITSDEEGPFINGTTKVIDTLEARNEKITYCIVGEPTSTHNVGDIIKNGRRGSISGTLTIRGKQGHVAYPDHVINPIHSAMPALSELSQTKWDEGNDYFPATSFQLSNINSGTGATNVVPGTLTALFNLRFSTELNFDFITEKVNNILKQHHLDFSIEWTYNGKPFLTEQTQSGDCFLSKMVAAVESVTEIKPELSTSGGTSDGRFIAPTGAEVIELGPCNATIHQVNESVSCDDLIKLTDIYYACLKQVLVPTK